MVKRLSVHRNTLDRRRRKALGAEFLSDAAGVFDGSDIRAFAFVALDGDGRAYTIWDTGGIVPLWSFPGMVEKVLDRDISEVEEDFEAAFLKDRFKRGKSDGQG